MKVKKEHYDALQVVLGTRMLGAETTRQRREALGYCWVSVWQTVKAIYEYADDTHLDTALRFISEGRSYPER
jgi:alkylhydroperoxidase family enzyme